MNPRKTSNFCPTSFGAVLKMVIFVFKDWMVVLSTDYYTCWSLRNIVCQILMVCVSDVIVLYWHLHSYSFRRFHFVEHFNYYTLQHVMKLGILLESLCPVCLGFLLWTASSESVRFWFCHSWNNIFKKKITHTHTHRSLPNPNTWNTIIPSHTYNPTHTHLGLAF